ncbi:unnamed protein product, partial [Prorocentrum cordatum]
CRTGRIRGKWNQKCATAFRGSRLLVCRTSPRRRSPARSCSPRMSLLVCVSPLIRHIHETVGSLDFAHRAISIEVRAFENVDVVEADDAELMSDVQHMPSAGMGALRHEPEAMKKALLAGPAEVGPRSDKA